MSLAIHRGKNILKMSTTFLDNAAVFTATEGIALGDFYRLTLPFHTIYVTTDPALIQKHLVINGQKYEKSKIYWGELKAIIGEAMGTYEGEQWLGMRSLQQPFFKVATVQTYWSDMGHLIDKHIEQWKADEPKDNTYNISELFSVLNIDIILKTVFGLEDIANKQELAEAIALGENIIAWRSKYPWRPYTAWLNGQNQATKRYLKTFDEFTANSLTNASNGSLTQVLYDSFPAHFSKKEKRKRLRNEFIVHLGAGTETAAVSLSWTLYLLARHPQELALVEQELSDVFATSHTAFPVDQLIYTKQVIEESLRLFPPSHVIIRDCVEEDVIEEQKIKCGDTLYASVYGIHRNPRIWEQADEFIPERFSEERRKNIPDYAFIPFGVGKHTCIGRYMAMPMLIMSLAKILQEFRIELINDRSHQPVSLSTLKPEKPILMRLLPK